MNVRSLVGLAVLVTGLGGATVARSETLPHYEGTSSGVHFALDCQKSGSVVGNVGDSGGPLYSVTGNLSGQTVSLQCRGNSKRGTSSLSTSASLLGQLGINTSQIKVTNVPVPRTASGKSGAGSVVLTPIDFTLNCSNGKSSKTAPAASISYSASRSENHRQYSARATLTATSGSNYDLDGNVAATIQGVTGTTNFHLGGLVRGDGSAHNITVSGETPPGSALRNPKANGTARFDPNTNQLTVSLTGLVAFGFADQTFTFK